METCTINATHDSYFMKSTPALHYKAASDGDSPDASMPMGNLSSPLVDSGYREGSVAYYRSESNSYNSLIEEGPASAGPPVITPVSGKLERYKQHRMIRPVPLKAISPSRSLDSPSSTSSKHSLPSSPSSMPDQINDRPPPKQQQQQQQQHKQQPPDVVLTNQKRNLAGNHFGAPPTKCLSLQDITPKQKDYQGNSAQRPPQNYAKAWGKQMAQQRHIQPAHSLNYLNRSIQNLQNQQKLLPDYKRRNISQSTTHVDNRHGNSSPRKPVRINHTNPSYGVVDYNSNRIDNKTSSASSSKVSFMGAEKSEIASLRQKVLEKEAQLSTLRDTMDSNEAAILKVHEEKHRTWEEETSWLRKELQEQEDTSRKIRHSLQAQIYKLEQEKKLLREKTVTSQQQQQQQHPQHSANKGVEDLKWQLRNHRDQLSAKAKEIANLRNKLAHQEEELAERSKTMASLEAELEKNQHSNQGSVDFQERLLKEKEAELSEARVETNHMRELKENLAKEVRLQEEELTLLRTKIGTKEKELSQERCEVAYLREVQEKLNQQLQKKGKLGGGLMSGKGNQSGNASQLKEKLMQREKDISQVKDQLRRVQDEKEQEVGKLRQTVKDRSSDVEKLQKKLSETEKDCSLLRNKLSNVKGGAKMTPLQRQLESDFMDMQVKLTTREREVFQMKRELALLQEKSESDVGNLKGRIKDQEKEQQGFQERLRQRETEIGFLMDKMKSRDSQIASLKEELEKSSRPQVNVQSFQEAQKRALELEKETTTLKNEQAELLAQVEDIKDESAMYKSKLDKISLGVRSLSTSQLNLLNLSEGKAAGPGFDANKGPSRSPVDERLKHEMQTLKEDLAGTRKKLQANEAKMAHERRVWQEEKEKVIKYQKQLQLNYVQMCRRNRSLERDLQQLTLELEHKEISHC